jgi:hypothetical protein
MTGIWPWVSLAGLGAFHGLNPAMGWLFAVGLGLQHKSRGKVFWALAPIGLGHGLSIAVVVAAISILRDWIDVNVLQWAAAVTLIGFGVYRLLARHRARRAGMQANFGDLLLWSFLMATGHGAGLMLMPILLNMPQYSGHTAHLAREGEATINAVMATLVHSAAMLITTGLVAFLVYGWIGLAFLRWGWINLDWVWSFALIGIGVLLIVVHA